MKWTIASRAAAALWMAVTAAAIPTDADASALKPKPEDTWNITSFMAYVQDNPFEKGHLTRIRFRLSPSPNVSVLCSVSETMYDGPQLPLKGLQKDCHQLTYRFYFKRNICAKTAADGTDDGADGDKGVIDDIENAPKPKKKGAVLTIWNKKSPQNKWTLRFPERGFKDTNNEGLKDVWTGERNFTLAKA